MRIYDLSAASLVLLSALFCLQTPSTGAQIDDTSMNINDSNNMDSSEGCGCEGTGLTRDALFADDSGGASQSASAVLKNDVDHEQKRSTILSESPQKENFPSENMIFIQGGEFRMGTDDPQIETDGESPSRPVRLSSFYIDKYEVSNAEYAKFVSSTGYRTDSEQYGWSFVFEDAIPAENKEGITQSVMGAEWWLPVNGSYWREPEGPGTDVFETKRGNYPATHISWTDANEFCKWRGARLPTEAEWEYVAQGTSSKGQTSRYPWGAKLTPRGKHRCNIFQGKFPTENTASDGYPFLAPVDSFTPQNEYGVHNMVGNVWEWVEDWFTRDHPTTLQENPRGPPVGREKVKKGGSFMCHKSFCYRYRTAARYATSVDSATLNSGLRCAKDEIPGNRSSREEL